MVSSSWRISLPLMLLVVGTLSTTTITPWSMVTRRLAPQNWLRFPLHSARAGSSFRCRLGHLRQQRVARGFIGLGTHSPQAATDCHDRFCPIDWLGKASPVLLALVNQCRQPREFAKASSGSTAAHPGVAVNSPPQGGSASHVSSAFQPWAASPNRCPVASSSAAGKPMGVLCKWTSGFPSHGNWAGKDPSPG